MAASRTMPPGSTLRSRPELGCQENIEHHSSSAADSNDVTQVPGTADQRFIRRRYPTPFAGTYGCTCCAARAVNESGTTLQLQKVKLEEIAVSSAGLAYGASKYRSMTGCLVCQL